MFGFGEHAQEQVQQQSCPRCQSAMQYLGDHGIRMGGLTGLGGAAAGAIFGQLATDGEEAFEKKMAVQVHVCPQCSEVSLKYRGGL